MQRIIKLALFFLIGSAVFASGYLLSALPAQAACGWFATCDAPPGVCGPTCNGGYDCVIDQTIVTRQCTNEVMQVCHLCEATDFIGNGHGCQLENLPYKTTYCVPPDGCPIGCPTCAIDDTACINSAPAGCEASVTSCVDVVWEQCCTPGGSGYCGNGTCGGSETCSTCASDCGACPTQYCGDGACNAGETCGSCASDCGSCNTCGNNSCDGGENCSNCANDCGGCDAGATCPNGSCDGSEWCGNCSADCGACTSCGDGTCNGTETCASCASDCGVCLTCGDGSCNGAETCAACATDCGACDAEFCGNASCAGFENCSTCSSDCGACAENQAWFQVSGGHIGSANEGNASVAIQDNITGTAACVAPDCVRSLLAEDRQSTDLTDGFAVVGSGVLDVDALLNERSTDIAALNTTKTRYQERYDYFFRNSGLNANSSDDFAGQAADAQKPSFNPARVAYYHPGDLTITSAWNVAAGEKYVVFITGNLTLDGATVDHLTDVAAGGFLALIVKGNIYINENLGNATLTNTTANLEGVFMADGTLNIQTRGPAAGGDDRFIGEGVFVGWSGVNLLRDYSDSGSRSQENNDKPVETFIYRPDFLVNMPEIMLVPVRLWQETN